MCSALPVCGNKADSVKEEGSASVCWFLTAFGLQESSTTTGYHAARLPQKFLSRRKESLLPDLPISVPVAAHVHSPAPLLRAGIPSCGRAFPPNHTARGEALTVAISRWSPKILATSWLRLADRICHCLSGWIIMVSWAVKKLQTSKYVSWYFCCHKLSRSCGLKVCEVESSPEDSTIL